MTIRKQRNVIERAHDIADRVADLDLENAAEQGREVRERIQSSVMEMSRAVQSQLKRANLQAATIPDTFRKAPKLVSPRVHSWLDFAVTAYFAGIGTWFAIRGKVGPASAAFINAGMVAGVSLFTDYDGTGEKPISFKLHGTLDAVQATTAAIAPVLHGFAGEAESAFFYTQAANELAVIATTDWDAGMPRKRRRKAA